MTDRIEQGGIGLALVRHLVKPADPAVLHAALKEALAR